jgi:hypothetical protein
MIWDSIPRDKIILLVLLLPMRVGFGHLCHITIKL